MDTSILDAQDLFKIKILESEVDKLQKENLKLRTILQESGIEPDVSEISDAEIIAIRELAKLKVFTETRELSVDEISIYDKLVKNLRLLQGKDDRVKKTNSVEKMSLEDLARSLE